MGTTIATKADLQLLRQEMATKVDLAGLRQEFALLRKDFEVLSAGLRKDLEVQSTGFHKDLELLSTTMTVRLGSMLVVGFVVMIAALKFLQSILQHLLLFVERLLPFFTQRFYCRIGSKRTLEFGGQSLGNPRYIGNVRVNHRMPCRPEQLEDGYREVSSPI